jgi:hypothetical protein
MNLTITLNLDQLNLVLAALAKLPFEAVTDTIAVIRQQGTEQIQAAEAAKANEQPTIVEEVA